jgi:hypothetical protein
VVAAEATGFRTSTEASVARQSFDGEEIRVGVEEGRGGERVKEVGEKGGMAHQGGAPQGPNDPVIQPGASYQELER